MILTRLVKQAAFLAHTLIARSRTASRWYFAFLSGTLRPLPECKIKRQIWNSVLSVQWPEFDLPPRSVVFGTQACVVLYPHLHQIDSEAMVSRNPLYEKEVFLFLEPRLMNYDTVVEIGANVGLFSLFFARTFERLEKSDSRVFVFEPSRKAYLRLLRNLELNSTRNVVAFNCAVGDQTGFVNFFEPKNHLTNGSLLADFASQFSSSIQVSQTLLVNAELLESLLPDAGRLLIKIDTEGAECQVLAGLQKVITRNKPDVLLEVLPMYQEAINGMEFLRVAGYEFFNITDRGLVKHDKFVAGEFRDWLLVSSERSIEPRQQTRGAKSP